MSDIFKIKLVNEFKEFINSLPLSKKSILTTKISFLGFTGFLGNYKTIGNNLFEYSIDTIKNKIYCSINDNNIIFFNDLKQFNSNNNLNELINWNDFHKELLKDIKYSKVFFNNVYNLYKQSNEEIFFTSVLKSIFDINGKENFKKITKFDFNNIIFNKEIETLQELIDKISFLIELKSIDYISEKSKTSKEFIESIIKIKNDINLDDFVKLIKFIKNY